MLKIIFVDDEENTIRLLNSAVDWEKLGVSVAGAAYDGVEGIELYESVRPDIVIADIRMPKMTGVEFAEKIRKRDSRVRVILLSAYAEFEYAQNAIQSGVSAYLLKPLEEDKLESLIRQLTEEIYKERRNLMKYRDVNLEETVRAANQRYDEENGKGDGINRQLESLLSEYETCYCILEIYPVDREKVTMMDEEVQQLIEDCIQRKFAVFAFRPAELYVLTEKEGMNPEFLYQSLDKHGYHVRIGIADLKKYELFESLRRAEEAAEYTFWGQKPILGSNQTGIVGIKLPDISEQWKNAIQKLVQYGEEAEILQQLHSVIDQAECRYVEPRSLWLAIQDILINIRITLTRNYPDTEVSHRVLRHGDYNRLRACGGKQELLDYLDCIIRQLAEAVRTLQSTTTSSVIVQRAKIYIAENYQRTDFSLKVVADYTDLSRSYFSTIFHNVTGVKFWDYVTALRIENARTLLINTDLSVGEICFRVGYENESHFNKKFRQAVGISPGLYRKTEQNRKKL